MTNLEFFKQQADFFIKDFRSRTFNEVNGNYEDHPRFFHDMDEILVDYGINEEKQFTLMKAQHLIANLAGFDKWADLIKASEPLLELGRLIIENREKYQERNGFYLLDDWEMYESLNLNGFDDESKLEVFKKVFLEQLNAPKKKRNPKYVLDFTDDENAQDMLKKVMNEKGLSAEKAILSSITQKNCIRVLTNGWTEMALSLWGHAEWGDPTVKKEKLDNPIIEIKLSKDKEFLLESIMETTGASLEEAILYCMLFTLESLGYHI